MSKKEIIQLLEKHIKLREQEIEHLIEIPPNPELGDYSFPCFILAKHFKKSPNEIALKLSKEVKLTKAIEKGDNLQLGIVLGQSLNELKNIRQTLLFA
jgi:arginyl-tRNA synthetase